MNETILSKADILAPAQCRAARALVDMRQDTLAELSGVSKFTINKLESGRHIPGTSLLNNIRAALESYGVVFFGKSTSYGRGVHLREPDVDLRNCLQPFLLHGGEAE